jgi:hypothetical protein
MKGWIKRTGIGIALLLAGYLAGHRSVTVVYAQQSLSVPKAFGHCVGSAMGGAGLLFEDNSGAIRVVDIQTGVVRILMNRN